MAEKRYICLHNSASRFYSYFYLNRRFFSLIVCHKRELSFSAAVSFPDLVFMFATLNFFYIFITTRRTARKARMKTQRHIWNVTLAGCLMDTMNQLSYFQTLSSCLQH